MKLQWECSVNSARGAFADIPIELEPASAYKLQLSVINHTPKAGRGEAGLAVLLQFSQCLLLGPQAFVIY